VLCDLDHTEPHPRGPTAYWNLGPLCRRHHRWKTSRLIQLRQLQPGVFELTMPTGHTHIVRAVPNPSAVAAGAIRRHRRPTTQPAELHTLLTT
jgi:hypothetical protein